MNSSTALSPADWRDSAACRDVDPDLFFPVAVGGSSDAQIAAAKRVCAGCPVRSACLDWALRHRQNEGIWGGTTEEERRTPVAPVAPRAALCVSGRHLKNGPGRCPECRKEWLREREQTRVRDQAAIWARRVARAREAQEEAA